VLKGLVPACQGVEMHKLAILQASIEYVRYLEGCLGELKKQVSQQQNEVSTPTSTTAATTITTSQNGPEACTTDRTTYIPDDDEEEDEDDAEEDEDEDLDEQEEPQSHHSFSSVPSSAAPSPAFRPQSGHGATPYMDVSPYSFPLNQSSKHHHHTQRLPSISPLIYPHAGSMEEDATTAGALLMLADVERRRSSSSGSGAVSVTNSNSSEARGMSVRDLLSS